MRNALGLIAVAAVFLATACNRKKEKSRFEAPGGFSVEIAAPASQTGSLIAMTFDSFGRPVVSKERGHPTILFDKDGDGVFETEKIFSDKVSYAQGMWFEGRTLFAIANDTETKQAGLYKLEDTNGDDVADTFERLNTFERMMGEHGPHAIRRGPDGYPYVMLGNHTFVPRDLIEPSSPLRWYRESQLLERYMDARGHAAGIMAPGGVLWRYDRESQKYTMLLGGFRNAYDFAFNAEGEPFTFDSDMEWDINLPWYRPVHSLHLIPGGDYGWRTGSGKFPFYFLDTLPPLSEQGRGSPVGVEFYEHYVYPKEYRDAFLEGDWSRGRILISKLAHQGGTYRISGEEKEFVHGEPLNVTDLEVGPDGFLYFTMGGRDTEGGLYRVRYQPGWLESLFSEKKPTGILAVVRQPQPLSSWGHASLLAAKEKMGASWAPELESLANNRTAAEQDRVQALLILQRLGPQPDRQLLEPLGKDPNAGVRAAAIYIAGQHRSDWAKSIAASGLNDTSPFVQRRAAEALVALGMSETSPPFAPIADIYALLGANDRFLRYAGRLALEHTPREQWSGRVLEESRPVPAIEGMVALIRTAKTPSDRQAIYEKQLAMLKAGKLSIEDRLGLLRVFALNATADDAGAPAEIRKQMSDLILPEFPAADERLNREYARTLAYCGQPEAIGKILAAMPRGDSNQPLQIHYVYCLRAMKNGWTPDQKAALLNWFGKAVEWRGGASFTGYLNFMFDTWLASCNPEERRQAYTRVKQFAPLEGAEALRKAQSGFVPPAAVARGRGVQAVSPQEIFEFQMYDPMTLKAKPERGKQIFEKECSSCHRFGAEGKDFGPDLTTLASRFKKKDILESILWPSKTISDQYQSYIIETKDNDLINGLIVSENPKKMVVKTAEVERPIEIPTASVKSRRISKISIMPEHLLDPYGQDDIASLIAFLLSSKK